MAQDYQGHEDDNALLTAFNKRHRIALKAIFVRQWKKQVFVARGLGLIKEDAEDIVQNVLLSIFMDEEMQFNSLAHIDKLVYKMVCWRCLDFTREKGKIDSKIRKISKYIDIVEWDNIEVRVCQGETLAELSRGIETLAPRQKNVVDLVREGYSSIEISTMMSISRRAVNSYLQTAITILRGKIMDKL